MVFWLHKLPTALLYFKTLFQWCRHLVIREIESWHMPLLCQLSEYPIKCCNKGVIFQIWDGYCKDIVVVIVICNKIVLIFIE